MRRLKGDLVELTPTEAKAYDRYQQLLDEGYSCAAATDILRREYPLSRTYQEWLMNA